VSGSIGAVRVVEPIDGPLDATVRVPGSKSLTNRALVCASLAEGRSVLRGALFADDTEAMVDSLTRLGIPVAEDRPAEQLVVDGCAGRLPEAAVGARLDARLSGTTARFLLPLLALGPGPTRLDGAPSLQRRPMADGIAALRDLGAQVTEEGQPGHLPVVLHGPPRLRQSGTRSGPDYRNFEVRGEASSQFLSGLLLSGPAWAEGLDVMSPGRLVSRPYVDMTVAVMRSFGAHVHEPAAGHWRVLPSGYRGTDYRIEPDASAASYFFAAAAVGGGRVTVEGIGRDSLQGDTAFVDVLEQMGCSVERGESSTTVERSGPLSGVDVDMGQISDTAPTLAVVAVFAASPTRVRGIGFIRAKETDRVGNVVRELHRCGITAMEEDDGLVVHPGWPRSARVETYDDHRMAMSFALLGLRVPGIEVSGPGCVGKTFPGFWSVLHSLRVRGG
jgi:3-phosphoshikimate 1-carboxyvinyltransferase